MPAILSLLASVLPFAGGYAGQAGLRALLSRLMGGKALGALSGFGADFAGWTGGGMVGSAIQQAVSPEGGTNDQQFSSLMGQLSSPPPPSYNDMMMEDLMTRLDEQESSQGIF